MKKKDIEKRIDEAFEKTTPETYDRILSDVSDDSAPNVIEFKPIKKHRIQKFIAIAAVLALVFSFTIYEAVNNMSFGMVSIDVNPSICMKTNSKNYIVECKPINEDGEKIIADMDLKGVSIDVAVNALIGSMLTNGYLSNTKNTVLVGVEQKRNENDLSKKLTDEISRLLNASIGNAAVVSVNLKSNDDYAEIANQYGISNSKAALIKAIADYDKTIAIEDIASLSVNDLNLLYETRKSDNDNISLLGTSNSDDYIGTERAQKFAQALFPNSEVKSVELDYDFDRMTYDVELIHENTEYEIDVDAMTGECMKAEIETIVSDISEPQSTVPVKESDCISMEQAKNIALNFLNIDRNKIVNIAVTSDYEQTVFCYNVEYYYYGLCYDFDINAVSGEVTGWEIEAIFSDNISINTLKDAYKNAIVK